jgi:hypothetical protein
MALAAPSMTARWPLWVWVCVCVCVGVYMRRDVPREIAVSCVEAKGTAMSCTRLGGSEGAGANSYGASRRSLTDPFSLTTAGDVNRAFLEHRRVGLAAKT